MATEEMLRDRIGREYVEAMRTRNARRLSALRMLWAAIQSADKAKGEPLTGEELAGIVAREVKVRRESLTEFERGNRPDLATAEAEALQVLGEFLPPQLSDEEIRDVIARILASLTPQQTANPRAALGLVMKQIIPQLKGRADGDRISAIASDLLASRES
jgi:uncharacterized protein YqeY